MRRLVNVINLIDMKQKSLETSKIINVFIHLQWLPLKILENKYLYSVGSILQNPLLSSDMSDKQVKILKN